MVEGLQGGQLRRKYRYTVVRYQHARVRMDREPSSPLPPAKKSLPFPHLLGYDNIKIPSSSLIPNWLDFSTSFVYGFRGRETTGRRDVRSWAKVRAEGNYPCRSRERRHRSHKFKPPDGRAKEGVPVGEPSWYAYLAAKSGLFSGNDFP